MPKTKSLAVLFFSFLFLFVISYSVSGYEILVNEQFLGYDSATNITSIDDYAFPNLWGTDIYGRCGLTDSEYMYCMSMAAPHFAGVTMERAYKKTVTPYTNFSKFTLRFDFFMIDETVCDNDTSWGNADLRIFPFSPASASYLAAGHNAIEIGFLHDENCSIGNTTIYVVNYSIINTSSAPINTAVPVYDYPINEYEWHTLQIDMTTMYKSPSVPNVANATIYLDGEKLAENVMSEAPLKDHFDVIQFWFYKEGSTAVDNIFILNYSLPAGEDFISANETIIDVDYIPNNEMPSFSFITEDKKGTTTSDVMITSSCSYLNYSFLFIDTCNPLFIVPTATDAESNDIKVALDCGGYQPTDKYNYLDNFTDDKQDILDRYTAGGDEGDTCTNNITSLDAFSQGFKFTGNCTQLLSFFNPLFPDEYDTKEDGSTCLYCSIYPDKLVMLDVRFKQVSGSRLMFSFYTLDSVNSLNLGFLFNATANKTYIYVGNDFSTADLYYATNITNISTARLDIMFNGFTRQYAFKLSDGTYDFYSEVKDIYWDSPIYYMQIFSDTLSSPFTRSATGGQVVGDLSISGIDDAPAFSDYNMTSFDANCSQSSNADYVGFLYFTDDIHGNNYINHREIYYTVGLPSGGIFDSTGASSEPVIATLFGDNQGLKYLFVVGLLVAVTMGVMIVGANYGSVMAGMFMAMFIDTIMIFMFSMTGFIPPWIAVVVFLVLALMISALIMKFFSSGEG